VHRFKDRVGHFGKQVAVAGCKDFDMNPGMQVLVIFFVGCWLLLLLAVTGCTSFTNFFVSIFCSQMVGKLWNTSTSTTKDGYQNSILDFKCIRL
jgi:hypothetical protein